MTFTSLKVVKGLCISNVSLTIIKNILTCCHDENIILTDICLFSNADVSNVTLHQFDAYVLLFDSVEDTPEEGSGCHSALVFQSQFRGSAVRLVGPEKGLECVQISLL